jgi:hypothetical protein
VRNIIILRIFIMSTCLIVAIETGTIFLLLPFNLYDTYLYIFIFPEPVIIRREDLLLQLKKLQRFNIFHMDLYSSSWAFNLYFISLKVKVAFLFRSMKHFDIVSRYIHIMCNFTSSLHSLH